MVTAATPAEIATAQQRIAGLLADPERTEAASRLLALVASGCIMPGSLTLTIEQSALADLLGLPADRIDPAALTLPSGFTLRRRGVEAKLVLDDPAPRVDRMLLRNVALGRGWFAEIRAGIGMAEIAARAGVSQRRVAKLVDLAFLAPDIVERIVTGRQPVTLTAEAIIRSPHRMLWSDQRASLPAG